MTAPTIEDSRALLEPLTGYTPGPWRVDAPDEESIEIAGPVFAIAGLYDSADDDRCDARLIAAAPDLAAHLRAALDREAELQAERDAARAEVGVVIGTMEAQVRLLLGEYFRRGVSWEKWEDAAGIAAQRVRAALASEPSA